MPDFLDIVGAGGKPGDGNLTAGVCTVQSRNQCGAGGIGVNSKPPAAQVLAVLSGFRQADGSRIRGFQLEIGVEIAAGSAGQGYRCLITGTRHIPQVIGGACRGGQIPGRLENRRGRNRAGLGDVSGTAALVELRSISVRKGEI